MFQLLNALRSYFERTLPTCVTRLSKVLVSLSGPEMLGVGAQNTLDDTRTTKVRASLNILVNPGREEGGGGRGFLPPQAQPECLKSNRAKIKRHFPTTVFVAF